MPMSTTPARSHSTPQNAANAMGVATRNVCASVSTTHLPSHLPPITRLSSHQTATSPNAPTRAVTHQAPRSSMRRLPRVFVAVLMSHPPQPRVSGASSWPRLALDPVDPAHHGRRGHEQQHQRLDQRDDVLGDAGAQVPSGRRRCAWRRRGTPTPGCRRGCCGPAGRWRCCRSRSRWRRRAAGSGRSRHPITSDVPASPASAPEIAMPSTMLRVMLMPAYRAAFGLAPTVRSSKPIVVFQSSHHTTTAASTARHQPEMQPVILVGEGPPEAGEERRAPGRRPRRPQRPISFDE